MAKGQNNIENVSTTRGVKGGYVFSAPKGTQVPTDIATPLSDEYTCVGFVSEDGFTEGVDGSSEGIKDINGDNVDTYSEGKTETLALTLIEMGEEALATQYGHKNVEVRDGMIVVKHDWANSDEIRTYVLELLLKNGRRWRKVIPAGQTSELGEFQGNSTNVAGREVTITYNVSEDNSGCIDYIEQTAGSATKPSNPAPDEGSEDSEPALEDMTVEQLRAYAETHGVDLTGKTVKADILAAIRDAESGVAA